MIQAPTDAEMYPVDLEVVTAKNAKNSPCVCTPSCALTSSSVQLNDLWAGSSSHHTDEVVLIVHHVTAALQDAIDVKQCLHMYERQQLLLQGTSPNTAQNGTHTNARFAHPYRQMY